MNYKDAIGHQQAVLTKPCKPGNTGYGHASLAGFLIGAFAIWLFYAQLRDIADDLRKLRIADEMAEERNRTAA